MHGRLLAGNEQTQAGVLSPPLRVPFSLLSCLLGFLWGKQEFCFCEKRERKKKQWSVRLLDKAGLLGEDREA